MKNYDSGYITIPNIVARDKDLPSNAKMLCGIVNSFSKKSPQVFAKNEFYAEFLNIKSLSTVSRLISQLVDKGYLHRFINYRIKNGKRTKEIESRLLWITAEVKDSLKDVQNYWASEEGKTVYKKTIIKDLKKIWED